MPISQPYILLQNLCFHASVLECERQTYISLTDELRNAWIAMLKSRFCVRDLVRLRQLPPEVHRYVFSVYSVLRQRIDRDICWRILDLALGLDLESAKNAGAAVLRSVRYLSRFWVAAFKMPWGEPLLDLVFTADAATSTARLLPASWYAANA